MRPILLLAALLPACTLIDQRTFNPDAGKPPVIAAPPAAAAPAGPPPPPGPPALLVIDMARPDVDALASTVHGAVDAARARKATVVFDVVAILVPGADPGPDPGRDAAAVAGLIEGDGVPANRINLIARPEAGRPAREVRVYIR